MASALPDLRGGRFAYHRMLDMSMIPLAYDRL